MVATLTVQEKSTGRRSPCPPKLALKDRPLLSLQQTNDLTGLFRLLSNDTRLRMLHALVREPELCVSELCERLHMKPQAVSNQLQMLADRGVLESRRAGVQIFYRIADPCVPALLERGLCLLEDAKAGHR